MTKQTKNEHKLYKQSENFVSFSQFLNLREFLKLKVIIDLVTHDASFSSMYLRQQTA